MKEKTEMNEIKEVKLCEDCLCSNHCRDCYYLDPSKPESSTSHRFKCLKRGSYHRPDECACGSFTRG